jgi:ABC-type microcin C transport system permease subunit YejB
VIDIIMETLPHADPGGIHAGADLHHRCGGRRAPGRAAALAVDRILSVVSLFFYSMPSFWLALMLMLLFSLKAHEWGWPIALPPTGMTSVDHEFMSFGEQVVDRLRT